MFDRLRKSLNIYKRESRPVFLLILFSIFTGASTVFSYSAAFALFLSEFEESEFALVFIAAAAISIVTGSLFARLERVISASALFSGTLVALFLSSLLLQAGIWLQLGSWLFWLILLWFRISYILINLAFWGTAGRVLNVEQGKRLFGVIGTGEVVALILGYAIVPEIVGQVGIENLLIFFPIMTLGSLVTLARLGPHISEMESDPSEMRDDVSPAAPGLYGLLQIFRELFQQPYIRLIFGISSLSILSYFVIDYGFYGVVRERFSTPTELARFISYFWVIVYSASLLIRLFVTPFLLKRFGLFAGLMALPLLFGTLSLLLLGFQFSAPASIAVLILISLIKLAEDAFLTSIQRTSVTLLYQPLPGKLTLSAQLVAESLIAPLGLGAAGLLILFFNRLPNFSLTWLSLVFLTIAVVWIFLNFGVFQGYIETLNQALSRRRLQGSLDDLSDSDSLRLLMTYLEGEDPLKTVYVISLLEKIAPDQLKAVAPALLEDPNERVVRAVIRALGRLKMMELLPKIEAIAAEQSPVSPEALFTILSLQSDNAGPLARAYLTDPDITLVSQAILGVMQFGPAELLDEAHAALLGLVNAPNVGDRVQAAEILGRFKPGDQEPLLITLLEEEHPVVQKAAIQAVVNRGIHAGSGFKETVARFTSRPDQFKLLIQALRPHEGRLVIELLSDYLSHPVLTVRTSILEALSSAGFRALSHAERTAVEDALQAELHLAAWTTAALADIWKASPDGTLYRSLTELLQLIRHRVFILLTTLYDPIMINRIEFDLEHAENERQRALALEALINLLGFQHQKEILPVMQFENPTLIWRRLSEVGFNAPRRSYTELILSILREPLPVDHTELPSWIRATAIYDIGAQKLNIAGRWLRATAASTETDPLLKETAEWTLARLNAS